MTAIAAGPRRRHLALLAAVMLVWLVCACGSGSAAGSGDHSAPSVTRSSRPAGQGYLALGDSLAFGYRPTAVTRVAAYRNPANFTGYPEDVARALKLRAVNASCPGETTASMINPTAPNSGCETSADGNLGYRSLAPLHVSYTGSQLGFALRYLRQHPDTKLVTIDIGANDMFLCQQTTPDHCTGADFAHALAAVTKNLDAILNAMRNQAHYRRTLVVLTYYTLDYADRTSVAQTEALNAALATPAAHYAARLADGFTAFRAASARAAGNACAAGLAIRLTSGACDEHPTAHGQQVLAQAIEQALNRRVAG
jgi:lysophospholipase L1-like esterase